MVIVRCFLLGLFLSAWAQAEKPSKASLRAAWEAALRADTETVTFDSVGENLYLFETQRFPFRDTLRVLGLHIDAVPMPTDEPQYSGFVEVELVGLPEEVTERYGYQTWTSQNRLYHVDGTWITEEAYRDVQVESFGPGGMGFVYQLIYGNFFWLLFLVGIFAWLWFTSRKSRVMLDEAQETAREATASGQALAQESIAIERRLLELAERQAALTEEQNRLLADLVERMRN